eukprot:TRINITY_DN3290_c0_g1_i1.p1 TRINITY_DN3290_c0_g1~~TRINITY_DN3290_c0_g1_i1.p1  ORF type:complete len:230 (+),score=31.65 TRINITY_DN3290_c0_g1_i1:159-848(+)
MFLGRVGGCPAVSRAVFVSSSWRASSPPSLSSQAHLFFPWTVKPQKATSVVTPQLRFFRSLARAPKTFLQSTPSSFTSTTLLASRLANYSEVVGPMSVLNSPTRRWFSSAPITNREGNNTNDSNGDSWWKRYTAERKEHPKYSTRWWLEKLYVCTVFAITGSTAMVVVRYLLHQQLQLEGSLWSGPWFYRLVYFLVMTPTYSATLLLTGTIFGRQAFFLKILKRMWRIK